MEAEAGVEDPGQTELLTTTFCAPSLRTLWRQAGSPLPARWHAQYPDVFDVDDLKLAEGKQRQNHFAEWVAAIYLFERDGSRSLVEKYDTYENHRRGSISRSHRRKVSEYERVASEADRTVLHEIGKEFGVQLPDLFVISPDDRSYGFAEVKGPGDRTFKRPNQRGSRFAIRKRLGVSVEVIEVSLDPSLDDA